MGSGWYNRNKQMYLNTLNKQKTNQTTSGFSLIEMLVVIAVIGIVAAIAIPSITNIRGSAKVAATAADFKNFAQAFRAHKLLEGEYPPDTREEVPAGTMYNYLAEGSFEKEAAIGGRYNWEGEAHHPYPAISLTSTPASNEELVALDEILDDGNLSTGFFRWMNHSGRYTYILEYHW